MPSSLLRLPLCPRRKGCPARQGSSSRSHRSQAGRGQQAEQERAVKLCAALLSDRRSELFSSLPSWIAVLSSQHCFCLCLLAALSSSVVVIVVIRVDSTHQSCIASSTSATHPLLAKIFDISTRTPTCAGKSSESHHASVDGGNNVEIFFAEERSQMRIQPKMEIDGEELSLQPKTIKSKRKSYNKTSILRDSKVISLTFD